jgi:hypothetical protein
LSEAKPVREKMPIDAFFDHRFATAMIIVIVFCQYCDDYLQGGGLAGEETSHGNVHGSFVWVSDL